MKLLHKNKGITASDVIRIALLITISIAALLHYRPMFRYTASIFMEPLEDMSHGWLIPFFSLYVLWSQRDAWRKGAANPSWRGALWVAVALVVAWFGGRGKQTRIEQISFIMLIWSLPYALWGGSVGRLMRFPAAFLLFTVPISSFVDFFTIHLRILSTRLASGLLNGIGVVVERSGTALYSRTAGAEFNVDVADPCSGIRSLFALMALTAAYSYLNQRGWLRKWMLFAFSLPIAVVGNIVRLISICLVAAWFGQEVATGYYHDYSGFVTYLVDVLLMLQVSNLIKTHTSFLDKWQRSKDATRSTLSPASRQPPYHCHTGVCGGVAVLVLGFFLISALMPESVYDDELDVARTLPEQVGKFTSDVPWFCQNPQCLYSVEERRLKQEPESEGSGYKCPRCGQALHSISLGEQFVLPADTTILKRNYRAPDGRRYTINMVISGHSRSSIHRPEFCLPSQGFIMQEATRLQLDIGADKTLPVRRILFQRSGYGQLTLAYWFFSKLHVSNSHAWRIWLDIWDRSIHNRNNRWAMVVVQTNSPLDTPESIAELERFLSEFYPAIKNSDRARCHPTGNSLFSRDSFHILQRLFV